MAVDARVVANHLLALAEVNQRTLDQLQLQKLTYLAHGWHLGLAELPLITQMVVAWPYGPVIPVLYREFKSFGDGPILGRSWGYMGTPLNDYSRSVVDSVWGNFGDLSGKQLISLTHQPGSPWAVVTEGKRPADIRDIPIPNSLIQRYYRQLALQNQERR